MLVGRHRLSRAVHARPARRAQGDDGSRPRSTARASFPSSLTLITAVILLADRRRRDRQHGVPGRAVRLRRRAAIVATALSTNARKPHMAKQPKTQTGKPNILVIWGDDIGQSNLSCYTHGLMGYHTPNIDRIAKEGMLFTDSYGEQSCTAGRSSFITGQSVYRTGLSKVGIPGRAGRHEREDRHHRGAAQETGLRHRPVRQEPSRRPQPHAADQSRLRRVLRQPLPPQCRGRAGDGRLSAGKGLPELPQELRSARRDPFLGDRQGRPDRCSRAGARSASRRSRTPARSPRSAWRPATTSSSPPPRTSSSGRTRPASRSSCGSTPRTCTCSRTPRRRAWARPAAGSRPITTP